MKLLYFLKLLFVSLFLTPLAKADILKFLDECTTHCRKTHSRYGHFGENEINPTKIRHSAEDIALTSCLQRCRLAEVIRPKDTVEMGKI